MARLGPRAEGEYSVTVENSLGSSTRDWEISVGGEEDIYENMTVAAAEDEGTLFTAKPAIIDSVSYLTGHYYHVAEN